MHSNMDLKLFFHFLIHLKTEELDNTFPSDVLYKIFTFFQMYRN